MEELFAIKMFVKEHLGKDEKLYAAFTDLEKAYREALWHILKIYGVGGKLMEGMRGRVHV